MPRHLPGHRTRSPRPTLNYGRRRWVSYTNQCLCRSSARGRSSAASLAQGRKAPRPIQGDTSLQIETLSWRETGWHPSPFLTSPERTCTAEASMTGCRRYFTTSLPKIWQGTAAGASPWLSLFHRSPPDRPAGIRDDEKREAHCHAKQSNRPTIAHGFQENSQRRRNASGRVPYLQRALPENGPGNLRPP